MRYPQLRGGANGSTARCAPGMKTFGEVIAELAQGARTDAEGVGRAGEEKRWDCDRARLHQRYRARPPWPASAGFRGATGGSIGSSTRRPAVLCRTAPRGRAGGTARSFAPTDRGGLSRVPEGVTEKERRQTKKERT